MKNLSGKSLYLPYATTRLKLGLGTEGQNKQKTEKLGEILKHKAI